MNRKYNLRLDFQFRCNNLLMKFRQSDNKTSDFFIRITNTGELVNIYSTEEFNKNLYTRNKVLEKENIKIYN